jgi:SAM-dependent methyltransferase
MDVIKRLLPVLLKIKIRRFLSASTGYYVSQKGFCPVCQKNATFSSTAYNYREDFICHSCGLPSRSRLLMLALDEFCPNWHSLLIHESSPSKSSKILSQNPKYSASQFYPDKPIGSIINGFRNENIENMTFEDNKFDIFITQDVLEHIYNPEKVFSEIERVLKPGGVHLFTVPIHNMHAPTEVWAELGEKGEPAFLKTEEWHGNPVSSKGSACTMHYGYDIVDIISKSCGMETSIYRKASEVNGIFNSPVDYCNQVEVFVSRKKY